MKKDRMKIFSDIKVGDEFHSTCSISKKELDDYLNFSRIKNVLLEDTTKKNYLVSGRAILARMEGEFTRLSQIYGNILIYIGSDGDANWNNRSTRFVKPLTSDEVLKIKFTVSGKEDVNAEYGKIAIDYEGTKQNGDLVVLSKKNWYRIKKKPPMNQEITL
ncbi:MAG: hypothetical protein ACE5RN_03825 [Nitrosopumilaceae archaeon]